MGSSSESEIVVTETPYMHTNRVILKTLFEQSDVGDGFIGERIVIGGWVKDSKGIWLEPVPPPVLVAPKAPKFPQSIIQLFMFIWKVLRRDGYPQKFEKLDSAVKKNSPKLFSILEVNDGSSVHSLQVLVGLNLATHYKVMPTGTCILVEGILQHTPLQGNHIFALKAKKLLHLGTVNEDTYPLSMKHMPLVLLRNHCHFQNRTKTMASVMRIRNSLAQAVHTFFQDNEFLYVQVPILTSTGDRLSGKMFQVTTCKEKSEQLEVVKRGASNNEAMKEDDVPISQLEADGSEKSETSFKEDKTDISQDLFSQQMYLTTSGRLHLKSQACALGSVYTYGPRFLAEMLESKKSLAEMWVVETEMAFSELEDAMNCAEDLLKFICKWFIEKSNEDVNFFSNRLDKAIVERLNFLSSCSFERLSYKEALNIIKKAAKDKSRSKIKWGARLSDEDTSYLVEEIYKRPVIIYNHPKNQKPFYGRLNDDKKTVATFDVFFPKVGSLVTGCQSEERLNTLRSRRDDLQIPKQKYEWYLDLCTHGIAPHAGFSLMLDCLALFATGFNDLRDVVPFPSPNKQMCSSSE